LKKKGPAVKRGLHTGYFTEQGAAMLFPIASFTVIVVLPEPLAVTVKIDF
jgi:hypothetical protein